MKIKVTEFEGTADEIRELPELRELLQSVSRTAVVVDDEYEPGLPVSPAPPGQVPTEVQDFISVRAGNVIRAEATSRFVRKVLGWGTTTAELGTSKTTSDGLNNYLMLYNKGPRRFGAFAYVLPGQARVMFRLEARDADGFACAAIRNVKPGTGYVVTVTLDSDAAHADALELAKIAYERVAG
jgi:hypothetical protein